MGTSCILPPMRTDIPDHSDWGSIDETADPSVFVKLLDDSRKKYLDQIEADPRGYYSWMDMRDGLQVLDVGSGTGVLIERLAKLLEPNGRVTGVDYSATMVDEAQRRAREKGLKSEFRQMDAAALDFEDNTFDYSMSNIVFQHLPDPKKALEEMVRVTKPGGRICIHEQDWETMIVDSDDRRLTRKVLNGFVDSFTSGWIGRQLYGLFVRAGLAQISVTPQSFRFDESTFHVFRSLVTGAVKKAINRGELTVAEYDRWLDEQEEKKDKGELFVSFTTFRVIGTKPSETV